MNESIRKIHIVIAKEVRIQIQSFGCHDERILRIPRLSMQEDFALDVLKTVFS